MHAIIYHGFISASLSLKYIMYNNLSLIIITTTVIKHANISIGVLDNYINPQNN